VEAGPFGRDREVEQFPGGELLGRGLVAEAEGHGLHPFREWASAPAGTAVAVAATLRSRHRQTASTTPAPAPATTPTRKAGEGVGTSSARKCRTGGITHAATAPVHMSATTPAR